MKSLFFVLPSATKVRELIFPPFPFRNFPGKKLFTPPAIGRMGAFFFRKQNLEVIIPFGFSNFW